MLGRLPTVALTDLHKGDAVMIVTTQATPTSGAAAITLLSGVEPILRAAPNGSQAMMLSPWSLGTPGGGDHYGLVAQQVNLVFVGRGGGLLRSHAGPGNDDLALGSTGDVRLREVTQLPAPPDDGGGVPAP